MQILNEVENLIQETFVSRIGAGISQGVRSLRSGGALRRGLSNFARTRPRLAGVAKTVGTGVGVAGAGYVATKGGSAVGVYNALNRPIAGAAGNYLAPGLAKSAFAARTLSASMALKKSQPQGY